MNNLRLWLLAGATVSLLAGFLIFGGAFARPLTAQAQSDPDIVSAQPRTITVVGEGVVNIKPDIAQVNIGVDVVEPNVQEANAGASQIIDAVKSALMEAGVAAQDMQTSGLSIWIERPYTDGQPGEQAFYHVSNQVNVTLRDLDQVGALLNKAIEAGANTMYGVTFTVADSGQVEAEARDEAMADARAKAEALADLAGLQLGDIVSVSEVIGSGGYFNSSFNAAIPQGLGGGGGSISPGELRMTTQLQVVFSVQ